MRGGEGGDTGQEREEVVIQAMYMLRKKDQEIENGLA